MSALLALVDLAAVATLVGLYFPRHRRRDLVVAYVGVNIGVLAVSGILATAAVGVGLGLGLFGVLSIIRLRSDELAQHEIAYYFSALAIGLIGGLGTSVPLSVALMAGIVGAMYLVDHPRLLPRYRRQVLVLDGAYADEAQVVQVCGARLGAQIHGVSVRKLDLVNDTTTVEVSYRLRQEQATVTTPAPAERELAGARS